jgi:hypothetical protein
MTDSERALILAFVDNSISQMQALRGALSLLSKEPGKIASVGQAAQRPQSDDDFGVAYQKMLDNVKRGNDDGESEE